MKTKLDKTDKTFQQAFAGFEIEPSKDLWSGINAKNVELGNVNITNIYSRIAVISAAAIIAIATIYYLYKPNVNPSPSILKEIPTNNVVDSSATAQLISNNDDEELIISDSIFVEEFEVANNLIDKKQKNAKKNIIPVIRKDCGGVGSKKAEVAIIEEKKEEKKEEKPLIIQSSNPIELSSEEVVDTNDTSEQVILANTDTFNVVFGNNQIVCFGEDATLFVEEGFSYRWNTGDVQNKIVVSPVEQSVYTVTVTNYKGFTSVHDFIVDVDNSCSALFIPSAFTPNFDGQNDVFKAEGRGVSQMHMIIYNKLGQKVFESNNMDNAWDGTYKGELSAETYIYHVNYTDAKGVGHVKRGQVTLIK